MTGQTGQISFAIRNVTKVDATGLVPHYWLTLADGRIQATGSGEDGWAAATDGLEDSHILDAQGSWLTPGFIDLHSHGAAGGDFDGSVEAILAARDYHLSHGTTRQLASLVTGPLETMGARICRLKLLMESRPDLLGVHLEGPFLSLAHKGAHDPACLLDPDEQAVNRLLAAGQRVTGGSDISGGSGSLNASHASNSTATANAVKQVTIAPERPDGLAAVAALTGQGVIAAVGHTDASYEQARAAFKAGARILTHAFNAMNPIHHRQPGPLLAAVEDPRVTIELINDGFHVQDPAVRLAFSLAPHRIALVTDSMAATGCPDGDYQLGGLEVQVSGGHARLRSNGAIAGSTLTMDQAVRRAITEVGISPQAAVEAASLTPARTLGLADRFGLLDPGYSADLLLFSADWRLQRVWCGGQPEFDVTSTQGTTFAHKE